MAKNKLRKLEVDNNSYLWKVSHYHLDKFEHSQCAEKITIYLNGYKKSPLLLSFREEDNLLIKTDLDKEKWCVGYPDSGIIWLFKYKPSLPNNETYTIKERQTIAFNFNRPAVIVACIKYFISNGWNPKERTNPFVEENALKLLEIINLPREIY